MSKIDPQKLSIRIMKKEDIDAIVDIDARIMGEPRPDYYERKCKLAMDVSYQVVTSLVAIYEDKVIGFVMGNVYLVPERKPHKSHSTETKQHLHHIFYSKISASNRVNGISYNNLR